MTAFSPHEALAARLLPLVAGGDDGSHDVGHLSRVWANARVILAAERGAAEGGDSEVLAAAVLLHDCVHVEKSSPLRSQASRLAAERGRGILGEMGWAAGRIEAVAHAIRRRVFPGSWTEPGAMCFYHDKTRKLVVMHGPAAQQQVAEFLQDLMDRKEWALGPVE